MSLEYLFDEKKTPYFIAEIGSNFDGSMQRAKVLIEMAADAGANAAKFQHYTAESLVSDIGFKGLNKNTSHQQKWKASVFETYKKASLKKEWTYELADHCTKNNIDFMTSPYSCNLIDYVDQYVNAFKIGSGDISFTEELEHVAKKGKPVLIATGASSMNDVIRAHQVLKQNGCKKIVLMQCNTNYELGVDNKSSMNLNVLKSYSEKFPDAILGLSDHTNSISSVVVAYALGARVFEKHFTDDINREGPDHGFSMTPKKFQEMVRSIEETQRLLGKDTKIIESNEKESFIVQRRALHATREIKINDIFEIDMVTELRPCPNNAIQPYDKKNQIGKRATRNIKTGETLFYKDFC